MTQKILILDNHDDFGGHAKRNEFRFQARTFIGYGGTMGIATPFPYSYTAKRLVEELGIQVERNGEFQTREAGDVLRQRAFRRGSCEPVIDWRTSDHVLKLKKGT